MEQTEFDSSNLVVDCGGFVEFDEFRLSAFRAVTESLRHRKRKFVECCVYCLLCLQIVKFVDDQIYSRF